MILRVVTPPAEEPVTLTDMKGYLRVDFPDDDTLISSYIATAREWCESYQNRAYLTQTIELTLDHFPHHGYPEMQRALYWPYFDPGFSEQTYRHERGRNAIKMPRPPIQTVNFVNYTDKDGNTNAVDPTTYITDTASEPGRLVPISGQRWPVTELQPISGVKVQYVAGYGDTADKVPNMTKQGIMLLVSHWYQNREAVSVLVTRSAGAELPFGVKSLLNMHRVVPT